MSKTSIKERNKAIRLAWEREQELVSEGKGTRDWSQDQQKDILDPDKGKAYDENGRAFEGQHMKSAAEYPEYQGDPDNIQFLTREEHLEAHKGSWQSPTNWYYNPKTKEFVDFGDNRPIPCGVIKLSDPVRSPFIEASDNSSKQEDSDKSEPERITGQSRSSQQEKTLRQSEKVSHESTTATPPSEMRESFGDKILHAVDAVREFGERHPIIAGIAKWGGAAAIAIGSVAVANNNSRGGGSSGDSESDHSSSELFYDYSDQDDDNDDYSDSSGPRDYPDERSSPRKHDVSGYDRQQNGKTVHVNPYKRGGKHSDD